MATMKVTIFIAATLKIFLHVQLFKDQNDS